MIFILIILVLLAILAGASYYLSCRLYQGFVCFFPQMRSWPITVIVCTVVGLLVLGFVRGSLPFPQGVKHTLGLISGYCMGVILYLLVFTMLADLLLLIPRLMKLSLTAHRLFNGIVTLGVLVLTVITCVGGFINVHRLNHVSYEVRLQGKQNISDLKVVMFSDLHLGAIGSEKRLEKIVADINALKPDVICIPGDFFDTDFTSIQDPEAAIQTLLGLRSTYGTYACLGNHDGGQTHDQMVAFLEKANIRLLNDAYAVIDDRLVLVGRLDSSPIGGFGTRKRKALSEFFIRENPELPVIVMDHNPANIDEYTTEADLILCGHTHKGQVFPGNLITNLMYTVDYGSYQKDPSSPHVIVTSGVGYWGMPMRVGTSCEIVTIGFTADRG